MSPLSMRCAPNQSTATLDTLMTSMTSGNISAISLPTASETSVRSVLAPPKRSCSCSSRTNARMTRMPVICSRITRLTSSMLSCMARNSGRIREMMMPTPMTRAGITASSRPDSGTSSRSARMMPPTIMIGAETIIVKVISASICTCWTSLVVRVISDGAPKWPTSRAEKSCTRSKMAARMSRPSRHGDLRSEVDGADGADDLHQRDGEHDAADAHDVAGVALDHAVVDDVGVERGQVERGEGLHQLQQHDQGELPFIGGRCRRSSLISMRALS